MIVLDESHDKEKSSGQGSRSSEPHKQFLDPPPLYLAQDAASSSKQNKPLPRIPPPPQLTGAIHLDIVRTEVPIKGTWTIDTSQAHLARSSSEPVPSTPAHPRPNLRLLTQSGGIDAVIKVKGGNRAIVDATCFVGPITLAVTSDEETSFYVHIASFQGDVVVRLPLSFYGPIKCRFRRVESNQTLNHGSALPTFSPSMQLQLVALSSIEEPNSEFEECSFFLGDLADRRSSHQNESLWTADEILVEIDCRDRLYFFWAGESTDLPEEESSLLESVLTRLKPLQEVLRKSWTARTSRRESTE